jgi:hypothetical protein
MAEQEPRPVEDQGADDEQDTEGHDFMTEEVARRRVHEHAREAERHRKSQGERPRGKSWMDRITGR